MTILDILSMIGGLYGIFIMGGGFIVGYIQNKLFTAKIIEKIY